MKTVDSLHNSNPFKRILFGFAFSPSLENNLHEVVRLAHFFGSELILLHVGEKTDEKSSKVERIVAATATPEHVKEYHWISGDPYQVIKESTTTLAINLLVLGAMQHESIVRFYLGSVARKLTRSVSCSVLLLIKPAIERVACKHVVVSGMDTPQTPTTLFQAFYAAQSLGSNQITVVEEIANKTVKISVEDDRSLLRSLRKKNALEAEEGRRVKRLIEQLPALLTKDLPVVNQPIFGRRGYSIGHYAEVVRADLLVMGAPSSSSIITRIFTRDIEYILSDLPSDLLICRE
mgnify:FL=1